MHADGMWPEGPCFEWDSDINNLSAPRESIYAFCLSRIFPFFFFEEIQSFHSTLLFNRPTKPFVPNVLPLSRCVSQNIWFCLSIWSVSHPEHVLQCIVALCKSTPPPHIMSESANVAAVEISMCCTLNHGFLQVDWQEQSGWLMFTAPNHQAYN